MRWKRLFRNLVLGGAALGGGVTLANVTACDSGRTVSDTGIADVCCHIADAAPTPDWYGHIADAPPAPDWYSHIADAYVPDTTSDATLDGVPAIADMAPPDSADLGRDAADGGAPDADSAPDSASDAAGDTGAQTG